MEDTVMSSKSFSAEEIVNKHFPETVMRLAEDEHLL